MKQLIILSGSLLFLAACSGTSQQSQSHGPIRLGDAQFIVTETDSQYLHDIVPDMQPIPQDTAATTETPTAKDTATTTPAAQPTAPTQAAPTGNGLTIAFKEVTLFVPGITTKSFTKPDLTKSSSAGYQLATGKLAGNTLQVSGGSTITKVTQRYQTIIALQNEDGETLPLTTLGTYSSQWEALTGKSSYSLSGLNPASLQHPNTNPNAVRNAVTAAARAQRISRDDTKDWQTLARTTRTIGQPPTTVILKNVSWRIDGKDQSGKAFHKEVRIDIP